METATPTLHISAQNSSEFNLIVDVPEGFNQLIGRDLSVDVVIPDPAVSRRHARLSHDAGGVWLEDLGSANGTYVNGTRITDRCRLRDQDQVRFGESVAVFHDVANVVDPTVIVGGGAGVGMAAGAGLQAVEAAGVQAVGVGPQPVETAWPPPGTTGGPQPLGAAGTPPLETAQPQAVETAWPPPGATTGPQPLGAGTPPLETAQPQAVETAWSPPGATTGPQPVGTIWPPPGTTGGPQPLGAAGTPPLETAQPQAVETAWSPPGATTEPQPLGAAGTPPLETAQPQPIETAWPRPGATTAPQPIEPVADSLRGTPANDWQPAGPPGPPPAGPVDHDALTATNCPSCGTKNPAELWFCARCGYQQRPISLQVAGSTPRTVAASPEEFVTSHGEVRHQPFQRAMRAGNGGQRPRYNEGLSGFTIAFRCVAVLLLLVVIIGGLVALADGVTKHL